MYDREFDVRNGKVFVEERGARQGMVSLYSAKMDVREGTGRTTRKGVHKERGVRQEKAYAEKGLYDKERRQQRRGRTAGKGVSRERAYVRERRK